MITSSKCRFPPTVYQHPSLPWKYPYSIHYEVILQHRSDEDSNATNDSFENSSVKRSLLENKFESVETLVVLDSNISHYVASSSPKASACGGMNTSRC